MEGVGRAAAVRSGIGKRIDNLQLFDHRAGPSVRDDERQRIFMFRADMNEMNIQSIDLGDEVRQGIQPRLTLAPVVMRLPVAQKLLNSLERYALRVIGDGLLVG